MFAEEEIRRILHAWRGAEMPAQFAVSMQDVASLVREADCALQEIGEKTAEDIARLTQETRTIFGWVEEAFGDMDSRVESMGASLKQLRDWYEEQIQHMQATLQIVVALGQRLLQVEEHRKEEGAQHQAQMKKLKAHISYLQNMVKIEVEAHEQANAALQKATREQVKLKGEVQDLLVQLQAALDQIHNMFVDLASTQ